MRLYRLTWNGDFPAKQMTEDFKKFPELKLGMVMRTETMGSGWFHALYLLPKASFEAQLEETARRWNPDDSEWIQSDPNVFVVFEKARANSILHVRSPRFVVGASLSGFSKLQKEGTSEKGPLDPGTKIFTWGQNEGLHNEWTPEELAKRRWREEGVIVRHRDYPNGIYYDVIHQDGTIGSYDLSEFEVEIGR